MTDAGIEKRLWLLEKEIKAYGKKIDLLMKAVNSIKEDVSVLASVQKTWEELVNGKPDKEPS
jgi:hypothetical protein